MHWVAGAKKRNYVFWRKKGLKIVDLLFFTKIDLVNVANGQCCLDE